MNSGPARRRSPGQPDLLDQASEGEADVAVQQPGPKGGNEQRRAGRSRQESLPQVYVARQSERRAWVQRHQALLVELGVAQRQHLILDIEVVVIKCDRL